MDPKETYSEDLGGGLQLEQRHKDGSGETHTGSENILGMERRI